MTGVQTCALPIYCRIVAALAKTIAIQAEIDILYPEIEQDIIIIEPSDT